MAFVYGLDVNICMANCVKKTLIALNDLKNPDVSQKLFETVAAWLQNKTTNDLQFLGTKEQIGVVKEAISASKSFQDELFNPDSTLSVLEIKLNDKHQSAKCFEKTFNLSWPL